MDLDIENQNTNSEQIRNNQSGLSLPKNLIVVDSGSGARNLKEKRKDEDQNPINYQNIIKNILYYQQLLQLSCAFAEKRLDGDS